MLSKFSASTLYHVTRGCALSRSATFRTKSSTNTGFSYARSVTAFSSCRLSSANSSELAEHSTIATTSSIQTGPDRRYDYILPCTLLFSNIQSSQVFRTDLLTNFPSNLYSNDDKVASDHLPVLMVFNNPFTKPFVLTSFTRNNQNLSATWEAVPGQSYRVESSSNLTSWTTLVDNLLATNYNFTVNTNLPASAQFFRVKRLN
jgi:hypothetical protein